MIVSQLGLLYLCLKFAPEPVTDVEAQDAAAEDEPLTHESQERENASNKTDLVSRPFIPFTDFGKFLELFAGLVVFLAISYFIFGSFKTFISMLGILAIGIESTVRLMPCSSYKSKLIVMTSGSCPFLNCSQILRDVPPKASEVRGWCLC